MIFYYFYLAKQPQVGQGLFVRDVSRSRTQRHTTVGRIPLGLQVAVTPD